MRTECFAARRVAAGVFSRIAPCERRRVFREEAGVVAGWAGRKRSPVNDSCSGLPEPAACSGALFCLFPNTLTPSVSGSASKLASQRFAAPFSFVSQYASAKRVRERREARFPALEARRKASPKRLKQAFQRPPHRFTQAFQRLTHRFTRPRQRLLAPFTALRGRKRRRLRLSGAVNGAPECARNRLRPGAWLLACGASRWALCAAFSAQIPG